MTMTTELLASLADQEITFGEFVYQTQGDFTAMAMAIARKWGKLPRALQVEDLKQEMLLSVYTSLPDYDATRGSLRKFVVWRICIAARKELRRHSQSESRHVRHMSSMDMQYPTQEESHLAHQLLAALPEGNRQEAIINSLARTGSLDNTTDELLRDPVTRVMFNNHSDRTTVRYSIYRTARKLAERAQATA